MNTDAYRARIGLFDINRKCKLTGKDRFFVLYLAFFRLSVTFWCLLHFLYALLGVKMCSVLSSLWRNHIEIKTFLCVFLFKYDRPVFLSTITCMIGLLTVFQAIRAFINFTEIDKLALKPIHLCFMVCDRTICYIMPRITIIGGLLSSTSVEI